MSGDAPASGVIGLLLAAGAGERFGGPKALARDSDGTSWLLRSVQALRPCAEVVVVLGAGADEAARLLPLSVGRVVAPDFADGMGASLRAGLTALASTSYECALVSLVDLTDVGADVTARLLAEPAGPHTLRRAVYDGRVGHPVLLGRDHWDLIAATAQGDRGARGYLAGRDVERVECGDLAGGRDTDTPNG